MNGQIVFKMDAYFFNQTDKDIHKTTAEFVKAVSKKYANTIIPVRYITVDLLYE